MIYMPLKYVLIYFAVISVVAVTLTLVDRKRAKENSHHRIAEIWLLLAGALGGAAAMLVTMGITHHKTRYKKFTVGLPIMLAFHILFLIGVILYGPTYTFMIELPIEYLIAYFVVISLIAVIITRSDKMRARKDMWRIPETFLMAIAALGGAAAMFITMCLIRHKTRYPRFMVGLPVMIVAHILILLWLFISCPFVLILLL